MQTEKFMSEKVGTFEDHFAFKNARFGKIFATHLFCVTAYIAPIERRNFSIMLQRCASLLQFWISP